MYQAILTRRYLLRNVIPLLAVISVALCTAMVIIVYSVMHGFLGLVLEAGRRNIGDVAITGPISGFPYYQQVVKGIEQLSDAQAATATIVSYGLLKMPFDDIARVQVVGINGPSFDRVTGFDQTLYWSPLTPDELHHVPATDLRFKGGHNEPDADHDAQAAQWRNAFRRFMFFDGNPDNLPAKLPTGMNVFSKEWVDLSHGTLPKEGFLEILAKAGKQLKTPSGAPGMVLGIRVSIANERLRGNYYDFRNGWFMPTRNLTLTVLPLTDQGAIREPESRIIPVVNESSVSRNDVDTTYVYVNFDLLQQMLKMQPREEVDPSRTDSFGDPIPMGRMLPGRATSILAKAKPGTDLNAFADEVSTVYRTVYNEHAGEMPVPENMRALTWEEQISDFIGAVRKETALVTTLFVIISFVNVIIVLAIFWTVVQEKTRDIGILRSVGASRTGITWLFIRYALMLGAVGGLAGWSIAHAVVWNINPIHEWIAHVTGQYIWDPKVYYFNEVPNQVDESVALIVMVGGAVFAVLGALIPAVRAAWIDPVEALRYE